LNFPDIVFYDISFVNEIDFTVYLEPSPAPEILPERGRLRKRIWVMVFAEMNYVSRAISEEGWSYFGFNRRLFTKAAEFTELFLFSFLLYLLLHAKMLALSSGVAP